LQLLKCVAEASKAHFTSSSLSASALASSRVLKARYKP
jgi:hypothetical protein